MRADDDRVVIRRGAATDGQALVGLIAALADYERLPRPEPEAMARLTQDAFGPVPRFDTWLAEFDGAAVGYAIAFFTYSTFLARPTLYLEDLFVLPEHRARRIGARLFLACARHGYQNGCGRMEWQVLRWNTPAIVFYHRMGAHEQEDWLPYRLTRDQMAGLMSPETPPSGPTSGALP
jgi:GNAT superfamily N-acetyltransferase